MGEQLRVLECAQQLAAMTTTSIPGKCFKQRRTVTTRYKSSGSSSARSSRFLPRSVPGVAVRLNIAKHLYVNNQENLGVSIKDITATKNVVNKDNSEDCIDEKKNDDIRVEIKLSVAQRTLIF